MEYSKKFVSLDVETTHLDIKEGRIMEFGAVKFELVFDPGKSMLKARLGKKFTTLVNPEVQPSDTALQITGISEAALKTAPKWAEVRDRIWTFIGKDTVLGHNINFDLGYLRAQGLKIDNLECDSLEIAQTLLPLSENHSLEYLAEEYQIRSGTPHRALADSINTARVLAAILNQFFGFPKDLQSRLKDILAKSTLSFRDLVVDLPDVARKETPSQISLNLATVPEFGKFAWPDRTLLALPLSFSRIREFLETLGQSKTSAVIAIRHPGYMATLSPDQILSGPRMSLCRERFTRFAAQQNLNSAACRVLAKILIAKTYHDNLDLADIRWGYGELDLLPLLAAEKDICLAHGCAYRQLIKLPGQKVYFASPQTIFTLAQNWNQEFPHTKLLLFDIAAIEEEFTEGMLATWNLKKARGVLETLYPLSSVRPSVMDEAPVEAAVFAESVDLFFGILHLVYLKRVSEYAQNLVVDDAEAASERFRKIRSTAESFIGKIAGFVKFLLNQKLISDPGLAMEFGAAINQMDSFRNFLTEYFLGRNSQRVYWLKFNPNWIDLHIQPRRVDESWKSFADKFSTVTVVDTEISTRALSYYQDRLGLGSFPIRKLLPQTARQEIPIQIFSSTPVLGELASSLLKLPGRVVCVFPNEAQLKEAWLTMIRQNPDRPIIAHKFSGSFGSVKKKFHSDETGKAILCLTNHAFLRYWPVLPPSDHLIVCRLPFEINQSKPSLIGLERASSFPDHILPRAVHCLHQMLCRFLAAGGNNQRIWFFDQRILKDYDRTFMNYLEEFPDFRISVGDWQNKA